MRIVSWNCNGKFREKYAIISKFKADIYVVQECEDPAGVKSSEYRQFCSNGLWCGELKNKGLGVFADSRIKIKDNQWNTYGLREFISCKVNDSFNLIGVWAKKPYIEEYYAYQNIYAEKINQRFIIVGDFNSNAVWDKKHGDRCHTNVVNKLSSSGLVSAYHSFYCKNHGDETVPTFYLYRKYNKQYHIDYAFLDKNKIKNVFIGKYEEWINYSDHMPLIIDIKDD